MRIGVARNAGSTEVAMERDVFEVSQCFAPSTCPPSGCRDFMRRHHHRHRRWAITSTAKRKYRINGNYRDRITTRSPGNGGVVGSAGTMPKATARTADPGVTPVQRQGYPSDYDDRLSRS